MARETSEASIGQTIAKSLATGGQVNTHTHESMSMTRNLQHCEQYIIEIDLLVLSVSDTLISLLSLPRLPRCFVVFSDVACYNTAQQLVDFSHILDSDEMLRLRAFHFDFDMARAW